LVLFGGVLLLLLLLFSLFFGWFFCVPVWHLFIEHSFRRVPNWVAAPIARCSGQIGV
jgi:hypothetical protein